MAKGAAVEKMPDFIPDEQVSQYEAAPDFISDEEMAKSEVQAPQEKTVAGFGSNLLSSASKFAGDIGQAVMAAPGLIGAAVTKPAQVGQAVVESTKEIPGYLAERYGGPQQILDTLYKDPVGFAADLSTLLGGAGAIAKVGKAGKLAEGLSKAGAIADPIAQAGRAVRAPAAAAGRAMGLPGKLYESALKPSIAGEGGIERARARIATGVREEIPVTAAGEKKAVDIIKDLQAKVKAEIDAIPPGATVDPLDLAIGAEAEVRKMKKFQSVTKAKQQRKIDETIDTFLEGHTQPMTPQQLQEFKQGGYESLGERAYGKRKKAGPETEKQILRIAKEKLEEWAPDLENLNAREGELIGLNKDLQKAVERIRKHQMIGIGTPLAAGAGHALGGPAGAWALAAIKIALDQPAFKSKLAFAINRAQKLKASKLTKVSTAVRATEDEE